MQKSIGNGSQKQNTEQNTALIKFHDLSKVLKISQKEFILKEGIHYVTRMVNNPKIFK